MMLGKEPWLAARGCVVWASCLFPLSRWLGDPRGTVLFWVELGILQMLHGAYLYYESTGSLSEIQV